MPEDLSRGAIGRRMRFDALRYGMVWEDAALLEAALGVGPGDDVLVVTSAGDNALALLLQGPRSVTAVDLNPAQNALLALKLAAAQRLDHAAFVALLGFRPHPDRTALYDAVRPALAAEVRDHWDARGEDLAEGVAFTGRLERYLDGWREAVLHRFADPETVAGFFELDDPGRQHAAFERHLGGEAFREAFAWYFGERMMADRGRDPAQFTYAEAEAGDHFYRRFRWAFTHLPLAENPYLELFCTMRLRRFDRATPYLRPDEYARLGALAGRVRTVTGELEALLPDGPPGRFSAAGLSDVFEYVSADHAAALRTALAAALRPGGRLAYWSLLVDRAPGPDEAGWTVEDERADALWRRDRAWFYRRFHVMTVRPSG